MSETPTDGSHPKQVRLAVYLRRQTRNGNHYFKSKFIADELGLSAHEIGQLMSELQQSSTDLDIEKWGNSKGTTWHVQERS